MTSCVAPSAIASRTAASIAEVRSAIMSAIARALARGVLRLREALPSLLAEEDARRRIVEVGDVRESRVGHGAAERDEVGGTTGAVAFHGSLVRHGRRFDR